MSRYKIDQQLLDQLNIPPIAAAIIRDIHNNTVDNITIALAQLCRDAKTTNAGDSQIFTFMWGYDLIRVAAEWNLLHPPREEADILLQELLEKIPAEVTDDHN